MDYDLIVFLVSVGSIRGWALLKGSRSLGMYPGKMCDVLGLTSLLGSTNEQPPLPQSF